MHFAVIGSGPSGFYAAEALLRADAKSRVDLLDRFPTPFGLVRAGVAPDHPKIKQVCLAFERAMTTGGLLTNLSRAAGRTRANRGKSSVQLTLCSAL